MNSTEKDKAVKDIVLGTPTGFLAFGFGSGLSPLAPGTMGTLVAVLIVALMRVPAPLYLLATAAVIVIGTLASGQAEAVLGEKDPGCVVIDEVAGYMVAMALLPVTPGYILASFVLFRAFDILKPPPIRGLQGLKGGIGVMADDLLAGAMVNAILQIWKIST